MRDTLMTGLACLGGLCVVCTAIVLAYAILEGIQFRRAGARGEMDG